MNGHRIIESSLAVLLLTHIGCSHDGLVLSPNLDQTVDAGFDLAAGNAPDLTTWNDPLPQPSAAQLLIADVAGTYYSQGTGATEVATPNTHMLFTSVSLPPLLVLDQYMDSGYDNNNGCAWDRYDAQTQLMPDLDAGAITLSGYDTTAVATEEADLAKATVTPPSTLGCYLGLQPSYYKCIFRGHGWQGLNGYSTDEVIFPPNPNEQHPLVSNAKVSWSIAGSSDFDAFPSVVVTAPDGPTLTTVNGHTATTLDGAAFSPQTGFSVGWSCPTCETNNALDLVAMQVTTSRASRELAADRSEYGSAFCLTWGGVLSQFTLSPSAVGQILGGQSGGSVSIQLMHIRVLSRSSNKGGHSVYFVAGHGLFGLANLP
jgi:hypothetical protein